jgi:hypothetical protein
MKSTQPDYQEIQLMFSEACMERGITAANTGGWSEFRTPMLYSPSSNY